MPRLTGWPFLARNTMGAPRILVRGEIPRALQCVRVLTFVLAGVALVVWLVGKPPALFVFAVGLVAWLVCEALALRYRLRRTWIQVGRDGFTVTDRNGTREIRDERVVGIACHVAKVLSNGVHSANRRRCRLWLVGGGAPIEMDNSLPLSGADPMGPLIERLIQLMSDAFRAAIEHGLPIQGDGWELGRDELRLIEPKGRPSEVIPISEIAAIEVRDGKMGIWRRGEERPSARLNPDGRNAWLLPRLLEKQLMAASQTEIPAGSLGRILFQRAPGKVVLVLAVLAFLPILIGLPAMFVAPARLAGLAIILFGVLLQVAALLLWLSRFTVHEAGVVKSGLFGTRTVFFADVASLSYGKTRHYHKGAYAGTATRIRLHPRPGAGRAVTYRGSSHGDDEELDDLQETISRLLGAKMLERLQRGEEVAWTNNLAFAMEGIRYRPAGLFTAKGMKLLPYDAYQGMNIDEAFFYLFEKNRTAALMKERTDSPNFFPGYFVLLMLLHDAEAARGTTEKPSPVPWLLREPTAVEAEPT